VSELKPCPFCGSEAERMLKIDLFTGCGAEAVQCSNEKCPAQPCARAKTSAVAARRWNTRAGDSHA
jgi:hypothetical protein